MHTPWLRRVFLLAALAAAPLAACGGGTKPGTTLQNGGAPAGSLAAALTTELGTPVAILPNKTGLLAVSADGAHQHLLVPGAIDWALVDNRAGVVWFGTRDSIRLLDLTLAAPTSEVIVDALPTEVIEGSPGIVIDYGEAGELRIGHPAYHSITVGMSAAPTLTGDSGAWTDDEEFPKAVAAKALTPAVRTRLVELWRRGEGKPLVLPAPKAPDVQVAGVDPAYCPDDPGMCGAVSAIPGTTLWRVTVSFSCGDGCHPEYRAYDPATKQFVDGVWDRNMQMTWVSADGHAVVNNGGITRLDGKGAGFTASEGVLGGGWLGSSWLVPF